MKQQGTLKPPHYCPPPAAAPALPPTLPFGPILSAEEFAKSLFEEMPSIRLIAEGEKRLREEAAEAARLEELECEDERKDERDYQAMAAACRGDQYIIPHPSSGSSSTAPASASHTPSSSQPPSLATGKATQPITKHLNADWMRPYQDLTAKQRTRVRKNVDHRFRIVFWGEVSIQLNFSYPKYIY